MPAPKDARTPTTRMSGSAPPTSPRRILRVSQATAMAVIGVAMRKL